MDDPYELLEDGAYRIWIHESLRSAIPSPRVIPETDPPPGSILKDSPETTVYRLPTPDWPQGMVVKRYNRPGRIRRLKDLPRVPRAFRALGIGADLLRSGIPTPEPLAAFALRRGGNRSWLVTRALTGYRPLSEVLDRRDILPDLVDLVRKMHEKGITHGDLKPANIQVRQSGFALTDLDASRVERRASPRRIVRDLAQLDSHVRSTVPGATRRAFFRRYTAGWDREARRTLLRRIEAESRRREARRCAV